MLNKLIKGVVSDVVRKMIARSEPQARRQGINLRAGHAATIDRLEDRTLFAAFSAGDVVIYRVGTGTGDLINTGNAVFLDEYSPSGTLVQSIALPTSSAGGSGTNQALIASGTATSEGLLTVSSNGQYLLASGYNASPGGTTSLTGTTSTTVNRTVGIIGADGVPNTKNTFSDWSSGNNPRSVASANGTDLYLAGAGGGIRYATAANTTAQTSTQLATAPTNFRQVAVFGGQLYATSNSGSTRLVSVGTGLPTAASTTLTALPGTPTSGSPYGIYFADLSSSVAGLDTMYVADDTASTGGIQKWSLVSGSWALNGTIGAGSLVRGLAASATGGSVSLFATTGGFSITGGGTLFAATDTAGYNAAPSTATLATLATAGTNTAFRGVAIAPFTAGAQSIGFSTTSLTKAEGNTGTTTNYVYTVHRAGDTTATTATVDYNITFPSTGGASASDFESTQALSGTLSFAAGEISKTITVQVKGDATFEPNEDFTLTLSNVTGTGATLDANTVATGTITNDDAIANVSVATDAGSVSKAEGNTGLTAFTFTVTRSVVTTGTSSVDYTVGGTGASPANNADFDFVTDTTAPQTGTVSFADGETTKTITVNVAGDLSVESDEAFGVTLSNPSNAAIITATATATIQNDDTGISVAAATGSASKAEGTGATNTDFTYTVTRSGLTTGSTANIAWAVTGNAANGNAAAATDFVGGVFPSGTISFAAGETTKTITVSVLADSTIESDKDFNVTIDPNSVTTAGASLVGTGVAASTIVNDDFQTLSAGDIVITGINTASQDQISFVPLVDLAPNSVINFTDNAWTGSALLSSEGTMQYTAPATGLAAGKEVVISSGGGSAAVNGSSGSATATSNFSLNAQGDNVFAFTGLTSSPNFLFAVTTYFQYVASGGSTTSSNTVLPSALTIGTNAVDFLGDATTSTVATAGEYTGITGGTSAALLAAVANKANWTITTDTAGANLNQGDFTVNNNTGGGNTAPTVGAHAATIIQGLTTSVSPAMLAVTDLEQGSESLTYTITSAPTGTLSLSGTPLALNDTFTQKDITDGKLTYVAPATGTSDSVGFTVSDGATPTPGTVTGTFDITLIPTPAVYLNEINVNPPGNDGPYEYIEIKGTPGASLDGFYFASIEGDTGVTVGTATFVQSLAGKSLGSNGLLVIKAAAAGLTIPSNGTTVVTNTALDGSSGALQNGGNTFAVIYSPSTAITQGHDYDTGTIPGTLSLPGGAAIVDSVGWKSSATSVGDTVYGGAAITIGSSSPAAATRTVGNTAQNSAAAWSAGALAGTVGTAVNYDTANVNTGFVAGTKLTPGAENDIPLNSLVVTAPDAVYSGAGYSALSTVVTENGTPVTGATVSYDYYAGSSATGTPLASAPTNAGTYTVVAHYTFSGDTTPTDSAAQTFKVTKKALTATASATSKVYDRTTSATVSYTLSGFVGTETVTASSTGTFADKNVGTQKTVTLGTITLADGTNGGLAANYSLATPTAPKADITAKSLTVSATGVTKIYDGGTTATVTLSSDAISGDVLTLSSTSASFADKNVGTSKTVSVSGISISGTDAGNYSLSSTTASTTAAITAKSLTLGTVTVAGKTYDGGLTAGTPTIGLVGIAGSDVVTASGSAAFADKNVGASKSVNITGISIAGGDAGNYTLSTTSTTTTAAITAKSLTLGTITVAGKTYDGGLTAGTPTIGLVGIVGSDVVTASGSAAFADKNVGASKSVNITGISIAGGDAGNYTLATTSTTTTAAITAKSLTLGTVTVAGKTYDGGLTAGTPTIGLVGIVGSDVVTASGSAAFVDKNVGASKSVNITGITIAGADAANYTLSTTSSTTTAAITAKALTATATAANKSADGTTNATVTISLAGIVAGDTVTATGTGAFASSAAGTGITVNVSGITLAGADAGNYSVNTTATTTANILASGSPAFGAGSKSYTPSEAAKAGTILDTLVATPGKTGQVITYSLSGTDAASFTIDAKTGKLTAKVVLDSVVKSSYSFNVIATGTTTTLVNKVKVVDVLTTTLPVTVTVQEAAPTLVNKATVPFAVLDTKTVLPLAKLTVGSTILLHNLNVTITLDDGAKGAFTAASLLASGLTWTHTAGSAVYSASGTAATITKALAKLAYQPTPNRVAPGSTETTNFTVKIDGPTKSVTNTAVSVVATSVNDIPKISGAVKGQILSSDKSTTLPFTTVTIADADVVSLGGANQSLTTTITLDVSAKGTFTAASLTASGFSKTTLTDAKGVSYFAYTFTGTATATTTAIRQLVFQPTENRVTVGKTEMTTFTISTTDGLVAKPIADKTTTVITTSVNDAPTDVTVAAAKGTTPTGTTTITVLAVPVKVGTVTSNLGKAGTAIGQFGATDADLKDVFTYAFVGSSNNNDKFVMTKGALKIGTTNLAKGTYTVQVQATDLANASTSIKTFNIVVA